MEFSKHREKEQMQELKNALLCSKSSVDGDVPENITYLLKDCRKAMASVSKKYMYELYLSRLRNESGPLKYALKITTFVKACLEISWSMAIQDPQLVFGPVTASGDLFDTELYKHYTRVGHYVDYIVWPALLLHEGGPVLAKGVAQGCGENLYRRKETWDYDAKYPEVTIRAAVGENDKNGHGSSVSRGKTTTHRDYGSSTPTYIDHSKPTFEKAGFVGADMDRHHRTRSHEETKIYPSAAGRISTNPLSSGTAGPSSERDPTNREMELFFRYYDRRDFIRAREVLGPKLYEKCWQIAKKNYKLY